MQNVCIPTFLNTLSYLSVQSFDLPDLHDYIINFIRHGSYCEINARALKAKDVGFTTRMLIRLVVLHRHGQLAVNKWKAIQGLQSHRTLIEQSDELGWAAINTDVKLVTEVIKADRSENNLKDLYWQVSTVFLEFAITSL